MSPVSCHYSTQLYIDSPDGFVMRPLHHNNDESFGHATFSAYHRWIVFQLSGIVRGAKFFLSSGSTKVMLIQKPEGEPMKLELPELLQDVQNAFTLSKQSWWKKWFSR
jgi:hypothetical protein